jgi:hypothetical protein
MNRNAPKLFKKITLYTYQNIIILAMLPAASRKPQALSGIHFTQKDGSLLCHFVVADAIGEAAGLFLGLGVCESVVRKSGQKTQGCAGCDELEELVVGAAG